MNLNHPTLRTLLTAVALTATFSSGGLGQRRPSNSVIIAVSPTGDDNATGTADHPFQTLERAQRAVREINADHDVTVQLATGIYRLQRSLIFTALDGGRNGHHVTWTAATDASPVISGAIPVTGWTLFDKDKQIYVANVPVGTDSRQLWVDDKLATIASIEIPRSAVDFTLEGITFKDPTYDYLAKLPDQNRLMLESTGFFTDRFSPVEKVTNRTSAAALTLVMKQPAWNNNLWGYDDIDAPYHPELSHSTSPTPSPSSPSPASGIIDPAKGKLYLRPPTGADINTMHVELPRLTALLAIGNSLDTLIQDLTFRNIRFSHTTWLGPATEEGYASQQSGSFLTGRALAYPANPLTECRMGCTAFESVRNEWSQMPASIQVAAAQRITFTNDIFAHLGQYALGIGNDADANLTGAGLGTGDITITR